MCRLRVMRERIQGTINRGYSIYVGPNHIRYEYDTLSEGKINNTSNKGVQLRGNIIIRTKYDYQKKCNIYVFVYMVGPD